MSFEMTSMPYEEPSLILILITASFLIGLLVFEEAFKIVFGAGLLGQIAIGLVYGKPLTSILPEYLQEAVRLLGYLGLMLLITEGGLQVDLTTFSSAVNVVLSFCTGLTGVVLPIGLSLLLLFYGFGFGLLESFSLGAALSSTSLGTTFAILNDRAKTPESAVSENGLLEPMSPSRRRGTVTSILVGAALLDDIVGLVISNIIGKIASTGSESLTPWSIAQPIVASFSLFVVTFILGRYLFAYIAIHVLPVINHKIGCVLPCRRYSSGFESLILMLTIAAFATVTTYIGSSILVGCFCAGALLQYIYKCIHDSPNGNAFYCNPQVSYLKIHLIQRNFLAPFFFASIGFAIPVRDIFRVSSVWKGITYALMMFLAKVGAGIWIALFDHYISKQIRPTTPSAQVQIPSQANQPALPPPSRERSMLAPALLLGLGLVARGEIGFLILNLARGEPGSSLIGSEAFMVGTWALVLNTLAGPIAIGLLRRVGKFRFSWAQE